MKKPKAEWETITPEVAAKLLEGNTHNRPVSQIIVNRYAAEMKRGAWDENNCETIKIAEDGTLVDGQHRLWAIIDSGVTLKQLVARGLSNESFKTVDIGKNRTPGDMVGISGIKNGNQIAAGAHVVMAYRKKKLNSNGTIRARDFLRSEVLEFIIKHREQFEMSARQSMGHGCANFAGPGMLIGLHYLFCTVSRHPRREEAALAFFKQLGTGIFDGNFDPKTHPVRMLRERLIANRQAVSTLPQGHLIALTIKAWNAYAADQPIRSLRMMDGEHYPAIG